MIVSIKNLIKQTCMSIFQYFDTDGEPAVIKAIRLTAQMQKVHEIIQDGEYYTVEYISNKTSLPAPAVSACLRNFRKKRFGHQSVLRKYDKVNKVNIYALKINLGDIFISHK